MTGDGRVQVAYVHHNAVSHSWFESFTRLDRGRLTARPLAQWAPTGHLVEARNALVRRFLDDTAAEWLWMVDTDMGFAADTVDRLVAEADPATRPVVGALCFGLRETSRDGMGGYRMLPVPVMYELVRADDGRVGFINVWHYPADSLVEVAATGAACLLVHRGALEKLRADGGDHWFDQLRFDQDGPLISEDLSFCTRLRTAGIPVHVHTGIPTTHHKQVWLGPDDYIAPAQQTVPAEAVAVIVPVLRRPRNAARFMASLRATTDRAVVYVVADIDDRATIDAWKAAGADVVLVTAGGDGPGTFARKANIGARESQAPWLFLVGDDVRFHPGWLDEALRVAHQTGAQVVGTNDLANARVVAGEHATHMLIRRAYVDQVGASWDGPGVVCHQGYRHNYVDDEIVTAAKQRGVFAPSPRSLVEHLHPIVGKAEVDEVYELGRSHADADAALFDQRRRAHA